MNSIFHAAACLLLAGQPGTPAWFMNQASKAEELAQQGNAKDAMEAVRELGAHAAKLKADEGKDLWEQFALWKKGTCEFWIGDYAQSAKTLAAIETSEANRPFRHFLCRDLAEAYLDSGRVKKAEPHLQQALDLAAAWEKKVEKKQFKEAEQLRIQLLQVRCKLNLGQIDDARDMLKGLEPKVFKELARPDKATPEQQAEREHFAELQTEWQIFQAEADLQDRNLVSALGRLEIGQKNLTAFPDNRKAVSLRFRCHLGLAKDYWLLARFDNAEAHLKQAESLAGSGKLFRMALGLADIRNARAALVIERSHLDIEDDVSAKAILANLDLAEKNLQDAVLQHDKVNQGQDRFTAVIDFHRAQLHELRGRALKRSGQAAQASRQFEEGRQRCDSALKQFQALLQMADDHDLILEVRNRRAWLNLRLGEAAAARDEASAALKLFEGKHGQHDLDRGRYLHVLLEAENALGNADKAAQYAAEHRRLVDKGLGSMLAGLSASEQVQFFRRWDTPGLHASLRLGMQHGAARQDIASASVEWLINTKAKLAEVVGGQVKAARRADPKDFSRYQKSVERQAFLMYGEPAFDAQTQQARKREFLVEESLKRRLSEAAAKKAAAQPRWHSAAELQNKLQADELYIGICALRPHESAQRVYHAWLVPAKGGMIETLELGEARKIDELIHIFQREIDKVPSLAPGEERQAEESLKKTCLEELSRLLLQPLVQRAGGRTRWIISPDGPLWHVPWTALLLKDQRYAIDELTFRHAISGQDLVGPAALPAKGGPIVLGDPLFNHPEADGQRLRKPGLDALRLPWDRLEHSRRECEVVLAIMENSKLTPHRFLGHMQKNQLFDLPVPPRIIYLSTHAFSALKSSVDSDDPLLSCALALTGWNYVPRAAEASLPGLMTGTEIVGIDLTGTELVVLASCQSGREQLSYGQSPANLRHAFHLAGARSVVSALWAISDRATQDLMEPFIDAACGDNSDKVTALRAAQQQSMRYLRMYRNQTHPYYWAGFTISGS